MNTRKLIDRKTFAWLACAGFYLSALFTNAGQLLIPTVAINHFTTDDNSYLSAEAAKDFTDALQAVLSKKTNYKWVERSRIQAAENELNLFTFSSLDTSLNLRIGKWVKADWLIMGCFGRNPGQYNRNLFIQIIDLRHADVLSERALDITAESGMPLAIHAEDIETTAQVLFELLNESRVRSADFKERIVIAPLFFRNIGKTPRLDFVEQDFFASLNQAAESDLSVRLTRFPKATHAFDESRLVISGLVEQDSETWKNAADVFVWGYCKEVAGNGVPFPDVAVEFKVHVWDGMRDVYVLTNKTTVANLNKTQDVISSRIIELVKCHADKNPPHGDAAHSVASLIMSEVEKIIMEYTGQGLISNEESYFGRKRKYAVSLLDIACFITPFNERAHYNRIHELWLRLWPPDDSWRARLKQHEDWKQYVQTFGTDRILSWQYYNSSLITLQMLHHQSHDQGFPADLPEAVYKEWRYELEKEYMKRALEVAPQMHGNAFIVLRYLPLVTNKEWRYELEKEYTKRALEVAPEMKGNPNTLTALRDSQFVTNADLREQLYEVYWPIAASTAEDNNMDITTNSFYKELFFNAFSDQDKAMKIFSQKNPIVFSEEPPINESLVPIFPQVNFMPPLLNVETEFIQFPAGFAPRFIVALCFHRGKLWISSSQTDNRITYGWGYYVDRYWDADGSRCSNIVWLYNPLTRKFTNVSEKIGSHSQVQDFCASEDFIWMALYNDGVWRIDHQSLECTKYTIRDGLLSHHMFSAAAGEDGKLFFGGRISEQNKHGVINSYDSRTLKWEGLADDGSMVHNLTVWKEWLLVCGWPGLFNTEKSSWSGFNPFRETDVNLWNMYYIVTSAVSDESGLWIGTMVGLIYFNPRTHELQPKYSVPEMARHYNVVSSLLDLKKANTEVIKKMIPNTRLQGNVTALADDGEFLWIATRHGDNQKDDDKTGCYVYLLHKARNKWVGYFEILASDKWKGVNTEVKTMTVTSGALWLGLNDFKHPLIKVNTDKLLSVPESKWVLGNVSKKEFLQKVYSLSPSDQAVYAFVLGDYADVVRLLENSDISQKKLLDLFLLGLSFNSNLLNESTMAQACFEEIVLRAPDIILLDAAVSELVSIYKKQANGTGHPAVMLKFQKKHLDRLLNDPCVIFTRSCNTIGVDLLCASEDTEKARIVLDVEESFLSEARKYGDRIFSVTANLKVKAINRLTGEVVDAASQTSLAQALTEKDAYEEAYQRAADMIVKRLLLPIMIEEKRTYHNDRSNLRLPNPHL